MPPITHSYNLSLVSLSVVVAIVASLHGARSRRTGARGRRPGAFPLDRRRCRRDGDGHLSMHFVGMLALQMPMPVQYGTPLVLLSVIVAMGASAFALWMISRPGIGQLHLGAASTPWARRLPGCTTWAWPP